MGSLWIPVAELLLVWPGQLFCLLHQSQDLSHITWQGQTDWTNGYEMIRNDTNGGWTAVCRLSSSGTATWTCEVCHLTNLMNWQISNHKPWAYPEIDMKAIPLKILFKVQTCFLTSPMLWTGAGECMPVSASLLSHSHSPCWKDLMKIKHFLLETEPSIIYHHLSWNSRKYHNLCTK
jgi:hypothetical protein